MLAVMEWPAVLQNLEGGNRRAIAQRVGVSQQAVSHWFVLETFPDAQRVAQLARLLAVDEEELAGAVHRSRFRPRPRSSKVTAAWRAEVDRRLDRLESSVFSDPASTANTGDLDSLREAREALAGGILAKLDRDPPRTSGTPRPTKRESRSSQPSTR